MARGRMISNDIARDKKINDLPDDTSRLAFTWLITFTDCEGRTYGDPAVVRSMIFPRRTDITVKQMEAYISGWAKVGLIVWYESRGDKWITFPNFEKHQVGLRKNREAVSTIPPPPSNSVPEEKALPEQLPSVAGATPEQLPVKLIKENLINNAADAAAANAATESTESVESNKLSPDTPGGRQLFALIDPEFRAKKRRPPQRFPSLACKQKFAETEARLTPNDLKAGVIRALQKNITAVSGIVDFVAQWGISPRAPGKNSPEVIWEEH